VDVGHPDRTCQLFLIPKFVTGTNVGDPMVDDQSNLLKVDLGTITGEARPWEDFTPLPRMRMQMVQLFRSDEPAKALRHLVKRSIAIFHLRYGGPRHLLQKTADSRCNRPGWRLRGLRSAVAEVSYYGTY
jgi:hypothetical protein